MSMQPLPRVERGDGEPEDTGIRRATQRAAAMRLAEQWTHLQPLASHETDAVEDLSRAVSDALMACMDAVTLPSIPSSRRDLDDWLDAAYVLERLQWCIAHGVPYVPRPRQP